MLLFDRCFYSVRRWLGVPNPARPSRILPAALLLCASLSAGGAQAGFLEDLFGSPEPAPQPRRPGTLSPGENGSARYGESRARRRALKPDRRLIGSISSAPIKPQRERRRGDVETGADWREYEPGKFVCVRMCDGAVIALARRDGRRPGAPTCDSACPGAEARLYKLRAAGDDLSTAVDSTSKASYADLVARLKSGPGGQSSCACGSVLTRSDFEIEDFLADATLRNGDVVATSAGLQVFRGQQRLPHKLTDFFAFHEARTRLPRTTHGALDAIDRTLKAGRGVDASPASAH